MSTVSGRLLRPGQAHFAGPGDRGAVLIQFGAGIPRSFHVLSLSAYLTVPESGCAPDAVTAKALEVEIKLALDVESGAGDETRTRDIQLGRLALYQLSYSRDTGLVTFAGRPVPSRLYPRPTGPGAPPRGLGNLPAVVFVRVDCPG